MHRAKVSLALTGKTLGERRRQRPTPRRVRRLSEQPAARRKCSSARPEWKNETEFQKHEKGTHHCRSGLTSSRPRCGDARNRRPIGGLHGLSARPLFGYEEPIRKRMGRWIERYPGVEARIGKGLEIDDLVEEVFLDAFEAFTRSRPSRPARLWGVARAAHRPGGQGDRLRPATGNWKTPASSARPARPRPWRTTEAVRDDRASAATVGPRSAAE